MRRVRAAAPAIPLLAGLMLLPPSLAAQAADVSPVTEDVLADPDPSDWLSWRRTRDSWGHSPLRQITRDNVADLRLAWSWGFEPGVSQTTPLVRDGVMYVANPGAVVHALDAATGDLLWEYRREMEDRARPGQQMRNLAIVEDVIVLNTADAHMVGLDARTGKVRWDTPTEPEGTRRTFTSGPIVAEGVVIAGQSACGYDEHGCHIVGVDGRTGRLLWRTSTIALPGSPENETWSGVPVESRSGGDAWIPGSYDPETGLVYWGTSQAKPWARSARGTGGGEELYTNSTLALDPRTGEIVWYYQHIPAESHDMDETFERILVDRDGRRSVLTMGKLGILWELDRESGEFVRAVDLGYQNLIEVDPETGKVTYRPGMLSEVGEVIDFCPGIGGFKSLRAMAYHPVQDALFVPMNLNCQTSSFNDGFGVSDRVNRFHPDSPGQLGQLLGLDLDSGEPIWKKRRRAPYNTSALSTDGGLVFVGAWDRYAFAYDAARGEELWRTRLPTMANGTPVTYSAEGRQYVAFITGLSIAPSSWATLVPRDLLPDIRNPENAGGGVYVFALPQDP